MVKQEVWHEIHSRFRLKESKKSIARTMGLSVQTIRKIFGQPMPTAYKRPKSYDGILSPYKGYILQRLPAVGHNAQAVFEELQAKGYTGGYDMVNRFVRPLREKAQAEASIRFETPPGKQGQVDWGQCWTHLAGKRARAGRLWKPS